MSNPLKELSRKEWCLWIGSLLIVTISNLAGRQLDYLTLVATWVGITSLIFAAKGNVIAQILMVIFSILYGIISFHFRYWGEMLTYLGMTMPMAIWSTITWLSNPSKEKKGEVAIQYNVLAVSSPNEPFRLDFRYTAKMSLYYKNPSRNILFRKFREYIIQIRRNILNEKKEQTNHIRKKAIKVLKKLMKPKVLIVIAICIGIASISWGVKEAFFQDGQTAKLGFEDIGELATQSATCTSVRVEGKDKKLFGMTIPFTQTKYIYTYNSVVKAGIDFSKVKVTDRSGTSKKIYVEIPKVKVLSTTIDYDSFKVYHEEESIFSPISMEEHNASMKELEKTARKDAIANGLLDNAYDNAKKMLQAFLEQSYDSKRYTIVFSKKK